MRDRFLFGSCARAAAIALLGTLISLGALAQTAIESVSGSLQGGSEVIRVDLTQAIDYVPAGFTIQNPARIALDFRGVTNAMGRSLVDVNQGNLKSINVVQAGERTRLVLNLKQATGYTAEIKGKSLLIVLEPVGQVGAVASAGAVHFSENANRDVLPLKDLDFRRGSDGAGRIIVALSNNQVGVDIRQQGQSLVVEFLKSNLPEGLRRKLDVGDFGTPVQTVTTFAIGDRVRMVIEPKGQWEHSAYQSDNQFVVEVRAQKIDPSKLTQGPGFNGEKLSLNFQNIDVRALLQVIADFTNFNIVTSDSVAGAVTLRLKDVPWDQALDIILQSKGLGMRKAGNVLWIAPKDELAAKEKLDLESQQAIQSLEPLRTQAFQLNYTKAADIVLQLAPSGGSGNSTTARILSTRGSAVAEPRTNQLFVTDIASRLEQVQQMISKLDIAVRQVLIEARIVEASDTFGRSLGMRLGGSDLRAVRGGDAGYGLAGGNRLAFGGSYGAVSTTTGEGTTVLDTTNTSFLNLPAVGQNGYSPAASSSTCANAASTASCVASMYARARSRVSCGNRQRASCAITLELNSASASSQQDGRAATVRPSAVLNAPRTHHHSANHAACAHSHSGGLMPRWYGGVSAGASIVCT